MQRAMFSVQYLYLEGIMVMFWCQQARLHKSAALKPKFKIINLKLSKILTFILQKTKNEMS